MADDAIDYMTRMHQISPSKPLFIKYAPGATHAPHHPTQEWVDKIHGMHLFDDGYEKLRDRIFENQKKLGVIPNDAKLTPWPNEVLKPWDQLTAEEKKLFIRQVEVFAAYAAYTDHEIGRVVQQFQDLGKLDNTLIIYINGDNGTSAEGGPLGTPNEVAFFNGLNKLPADVHSVAARIVAPRPNITAGRSEFVYTRPMVGLPQGDSPLLLNTSYTVTANIDVPQVGAEGMMLTSGGRFAGYGFYLLKGKPVWLWNMVDLERIKWEGTEALTPGKHTVEFDFKYDGLGAGTLAFNDFSGVGRPGIGTLKVDGKVVATKMMPKTLPMILQWDESFDIGSDTLTGVNDEDYQPPFAFTGKLDKLTLTIDRPQLSPQDIEKLKQAQRNNKVSE